MIKQIKLLTILLFTVGSASAQITTGSPFSAYGYGIMENQASGTSVGLGGTSVGLRFPSEINTVNPAAYSAIPQQTFLFNAGLRTKRVEYSDGTTTALKYDNAFTGINAAFSITDFWAAGFGISPFSSVGYEIHTLDSIVTDDVNYNTSTNYYGEGGLNKLYFATALKYKGLSLGLDFSYLFGKLTERTESAVFDNPYSGYMVNTDNLNIRTLYMTYGLQYYYNFGEYKKITAGITYNHNTEFNSRQDKFSRIVISNDYNTFQDTLAQDTTFDVKSGLPQGFGFGLSYQTEKWLFAADYSAKMWEGIQIANRPSSQLKNSFKFAGGAEFTPSSTPENYFQAIRYRIGGYYSQNYLTINGNPVDAYALTMGFGFPAQKSRTMLNIGLELGRQGSIEKNGLQETFIGANISLNMADLWFIKRKFD